jgi:subtilisin family serine protease
MAFNGFVNPKLTQRRVLQTILACLIILGLISFSSPTTATATPQDNQVIVQLNSTEKIETINQIYATTTVRHLPGNATYLLQAPPEINLTELVARMQSDSRVAFAEANYKTYLIETAQIFIYLDQTANLQIDNQPIKATNQWALERIGLAKAHALSKGANIKIAVLDSGVMPNHPALTNKLLPGYNVMEQNNDASDSTGHGTFVAGLLAQVAPEAKILPVKVVGSSGYGTVADEIEGIYYAVAQGAKIINISLSLYQPSKSLFTAVQYAQNKGAILVASVGNQNLNQPRYPAAYPQVIGVAATNRQNQKASYSNYGNSVGLAAPGVELYSTHWQGGYGYGEGTSFATPQVASGLALVWASRPDWQANKVSAQLTQHAQNLGQSDPVYGQLLGRGLINLSSAVNGK